MTPEQEESCEKLRAKYDDCFEPTEAVDGHYWGRFYGRMKGVVDCEFCLHCGYIRRADKQNKPCRGPAKITLREQPA